MTKDSVYRVREFATLTGVTVKALHLYDRMGLLTARRTAAGYRCYVRSDLARLEAIVALRAVGFSLKQIGLLQASCAAATASPDMEPRRLLRALAAQQQVLGEQRRRLERAIGALERIDANPRSQTMSNRQVLRQLVEETKMQPDRDQMKREAEAVWAQFEAERQRRALKIERAPDRVSESRIAMFREIAALLASDPTGSAARLHVGRWESLLAREAEGDSETISALKRAWHYRRYWPEGLRQYVSSLYEMDLATWERVASYIERSMGV